MRQRQRLSTFNTPRVVSTYEFNERYIILPRGLHGKLLEQWANRLSEYFQIDIKSIMDHFNMMLGEITYYSLYEQLYW